MDSAMGADSMSTATMRETPCSCMVTPISCSAISMAILLWLMNRNCVPALMLDTNWRSARCWRRPAARPPRPAGRTARVELEDGEHQRDGGERLLAARQQVDGLVLLARRLGHDLHAGVEDFVAGHDEPRLAAAEQLGNMRPKWPLTASKVPPAGSRVSPSIFLMASSSVVMASVRSASARQELLRSRASVSSSSAARLTAPRP